MKRPLTASVVLCIMIVCSTCAIAETLTYVDILHQLTDLDRLTRLRTGIRAGQYSSYARGEHEKWATNADAGQYIRVEENGEAVMMEQDGPGCIFRMWSANPQGTLRIYLDHAAEPSYELDFNGIFTGENPPFIKPLVYKRGEERSASDSYVPIPFAGHIKICADERRPQFYIFDYLRYPDDWQVESFHLPLSPKEQQALQAAADAWAKPGADPKPRLRDQRIISKTVTIEPGKTVRLAQMEGPGVVRAIRMKIDCEQRKFWRKLVLKGVFDGAEWPQVLSPVGPFFGFDWEMPEYGSLIAGCQEGQCYFYYPMPFRTTGALGLVSYLEMPAEVSFEITWAPTEVPEDSAYFFARWRHEIDSKSLDYPFIEVAGRGHLVGITLQVDHPIPGWWGEGDEKVWVDDDQFPPWIGTGSEDYFGDAWGIRYLPAPSFGCSYDANPKTCPYRWHFMDYIPFSKRMRMTIENYGAWPKLDIDEFEYSSVAYWYQAELTPPFDDLKGATYIGGVEYQQEPATYEYRTDLFADIGANDVRTSGLDLPFAVEAEDLPMAAEGEVITDATLPYEFNWERAVDFGEVKAGDALAELPLRADQPGVYYPTLYTASAEGVAELTLQVGGADLATVNRPAPNVAELDGVYLPEGGEPARVVAASDGRALLDCIQLQPAPRVDRAIEAEAVEIVRATGGEAPRPSKPLRGPSAGQILEWRASAPGDSLIIRIPRDSAAAHVLTMRPMIGPDAATIRAFSGDEPLGPQFDLYAPEKRPGMPGMPLGGLPDGVDEVEIRVVGKNPASAGHHVGLDYFRFGPLIIHPDSAEGVWARVRGNRACGYRTQDLGPAYVGGHHFWVQPCRHNGFVDIAVFVPEEGDYTIQARYTTSWDYAILQAFLDEEPLGDPVDLYTPEVRQTDAIDLGRRRLTAGPNFIRFQAVDKNAESKGYLMGIDYVLVKRAE